MDRKFLQTIREAEIDSIVGFIPKGAKILEIGSGAGWQANKLNSLGFTVVAIDIEQVSELSYNYKKERIHEVIIYDGHHIPFPDAEFDVIFTSNVLEHIPHLVTFEQEMSRVLKETGICIHIVPSPAWRLWSIVAYYFVRVKNVVVRKGSENIQRDAASNQQIAPFYKRLIIRRHGERGNVLTEFNLFRFSTWKNHFISTGWEIRTAVSGKLFFTGEMFLGKKLSISTRKKLSRFLGSYCYIFVLGKNDG
jgi:ubiquinone/menaquinone biosynthesis C-methylase UbiE